ncbi:MAG: hypothetical protein JEZ00_15420 [Anaerolineaceae bacterium]|nr:hypothetical protein [Anaerolineaceae bacterium]
MEWTKLVDTSTYFILGGLANSLFTTLHMMLAAKPTWYRYFGADKLAEMHEKGSNFPQWATVALVFLFGIWAAYGFSAAGAIQPLPFMRTMIIIIIVVYFLRSLMILSEIFKVIFRGYRFRFIIFSAGAFATSMMYYLGLKGM